MYSQAQLSSPTEWGVIWDTNEAQNAPAWALCVFCMCVAYTILNPILILYFDPLGYGAYPRPTKTTNYQYSHLNPRSDSPASPHNAHLPSMAVAIALVEVALNPAIGLR